MYIVHACVSSTYICNMFFANLSHILAKNASWQPWRVMTSSDSSSSFLSQRGTCCIAMEAKEAPWTCKPNQKTTKPNHSLEHSVESLERLAQHIDLFFSGRPFWKKANFGSWKSPAPEGTQQLGLPKKKTSGAIGWFTCHWLVVWCLYSHRWYRWIELQLDLFMPLASKISQWFCLVPSWIPSMSKNSTTCLHQGPKTLDFGGFEQLNKHSKLVSRSVFREPREPQCEDSSPTNRSRFFQKTSCVNCWNRDPNSKTPKNKIRSTLLKKWSYGPYLY